MIENRIQNLQGAPGDLDRKTKFPSRKGFHVPTNLKMFRSAISGASADAIQDSRFGFGFLHLILNSNSAFWGDLMVNYDDLRLIGFVCVAL